MFLPPLLFFCPTQQRQEKKTFTKPVWLKGKNEVKKAKKIFNSVKVVYLNNSAEGEPTEEKDEEAIMSDLIAFEPRRPQFFSSTTHSLIR